MADAAPEDTAAGGAAEDDEPEERVELQLAEEARLEALFSEQRRDWTLDDERTLATFFELFDMWIQLYRLNKCAEVLVEAVPICRRRGGQLHIKGVQALAFTRWKQSKFQEAASLFKEMEELVGPSSALCENMGHTYSSLGNYEEAAKYFQRALVCLDKEEQLGKKGNRAGVLLGLGLIQDRLGDHEQALPLCREAQRLFRERAAGRPSSLIAKAGMSIAKLLLKLSSKEADEATVTQMEEEAVVVCRENVEIFEVTCGEDSPLTASALKGLGEALIRRKAAGEAKSVFARAYSLEASKDAFDLLAVMEIHNLFVDAHLKEMREGAELDRESFRGMFPTVEQCLLRVGEMRQDGNAGAYYKSAGELKAFGGNYQDASGLLGEAIRLFKTEEDDKVQGLVQTCEDLRAYCDKQIAAIAAAAAKTQQTDAAGVHEGGS